MSVDRKGLSYEIEVKDSFSETTKSFVAGMAEARSAWNAFKADLQNGKDAAKQLAESQKALSKALEAQAVSLSNISVAVKTYNKAQQDIAKQELALLKLQNEKQRLDNQAITNANRAAAASQNVSKSLSIEEEAQKRVAKAKRELLVEERKYEILRQEGLNIHKEKLRLIRDEEEAETKLAAIKKKRAVDELVFQGLGGVKGAAEQRFKDQLREAQIKKETERLANQSARANRTPEEQRLRDELADSLRKIRALEQQISSAKDTGADPTKVRTLRDRLKELKDEFSGSAREGNSLLFTFRRLFGVLALFQLARGFVNTLKQAVFEVFRFNAATEDAITGVQSLITASGTLANSQGVITDGAEKFALANKEARKQVELLRVEGLKTSATFQELLQAYQSALAPGLRAGLSPTQIRGFAIRIAQAAASIGLPQNQLSEEIRSIFSGTIQQRTTRIAASLGITNEDIRRAKESGNLIDFLNKKFDAFALSGENASKNFSVIISKMKDVTKILIGTAGSEFFANVSASARDLLDSLLKVSDKGIGIDNRAVALASKFFSIFNNIFNIIKDIVKSFTFESASKSITKIVTGVNNLVSLAGSFVKAFIPGFLTGAALFQKLLELAGKFVQILSNNKILPLDAMKQFAEGLGGLVGIALGLKSALILAGAGLGIMKATLTPINFLLSATNISARAIAKWFGVSVGTVNILLLEILGIAAAIGLVVGAYKNDFIRNIEISGAKIGNIADTLQFEFLDAISRVGTFFKNLWNTIKTESQKAFNTIGGYLSKAVLVPYLAVLKTLRFFGIDVDSSITDIENKIASIEKRVEDANDKLTNTQADEKDRIERERALRAAALLKKFAEDTAKLAGQPTSTLKGLFEELKGSLDGIFETEQKGSDGLDVFGTKARGLNEIFSETPAILGQTLNKLEDVGDTMQKLTDDTKRAADELKAALSTNGVEGVAKATVDLFSNSLVYVREHSKEFTTQRTQINAALNEISTREAKLRLELEKTVNIPSSGIRSLKLIAAEVADIEDNRLLTLQGISTIEREIGTLKNGSKTAEVADLQKRRDALIEELHARDERKNVIVQTGEAILDALGLEGDARTRVLEIIRDMGVADAERNLNLILLKRNEEEAARVAKIARDIALTDLQRINLEETRRLRVVTARARAELDGARLVQAAKIATSGTNGELPGTQNDAVRRLSGLRSELLLQAQKTSELQSQAFRQIQILKATLDNVKGTQAEASARTVLNKTVKQYSVELAQAKVAIEENLREVERLQNILKEPIQTGFQSALEDFAARASDTFQIAYDTGKAAIEGLSSFISDSLSDALDPTKKVDVVARFQQLMNEITKVIIDSLVKLAIAKAILAPLGLGGSSSADAAVAEAAAIKAVSAATIAAGFATEAQAAAAQAAAIAAQSAVARIGGLGFNRGGPVGFNKGGEAFRNARGYNGGGLPRPAGLHPADTIPAFLTPGEFVHRVAAVQKYGADFMHAINNGLLDPMQARLALAGARTQRHHRVTSSGPGFNSGGQVGRGLSGLLGGKLDGLGLTVINVFDKSEYYNAMADRQGSQVLVNVVNANRSRIA